MRPRRRFMVAPLMSGSAPDDPPPPPPTNTNFALQSNGGVASATSTLNSGYPVSSVNNGVLTGSPVGAGGYWNDATTGVFPDSVTIVFNGIKAIDRVVVYSIQDDFNNPSQPTDEMTFTLYGVTEFTVEGWDGTAWQTLATVTGNDLIKKSCLFDAFETDRIRVNIVAGQDDTWSRVAEIECWGTAISDPPPPPPPPPPVPGESVAVLRINSPSAQTNVPFVDTSGGIVTPIAFCCQKGACTSDSLVVTGQSGLHVRVLAHWNDNSVKHAVVYGVWSPASGDNDLAVVTGMPSTATALSVTRPTDTVTLGSDSFSLASATVLRAWAATPDFVENHYYLKTGTMYVLWYVRWWSNGSVWVGRKVENSRSAYIDTGTDGYAPFSGTVSVGSFDNSGATFTLDPNTAFFVEDWKAGTSPATKYWQDPLALGRSRMVENFIRRPNGYDTDNTNSYTTAPASYVPKDRGNHFADMSAGGYKPYLGVHSRWEANAAKHSDPQGLAQAKINALCYNSFAICFRDHTSFIPPICSQIGLRDNPTGQMLANGWLWDLSHHANSGYVPYLLTGDFRFWEAMQQQCTAIIYYQTTNDAFLNTRVISQSETRGTAWFFRSLAETLAVAPQVVGNTAINAWVTDFKTLLKSNFAAYLGAVTTNTYPAGFQAYPAGGGAAHYQNSLGLIAGALYDKFPQGVTYASFFMSGYHVLALGHALDIEPLSDSERALTLMPLFQHAGKFPVGILGEGGSGSWPWDQAWGDPDLTGGYISVASAPDGTQTIGNGYATWGDVYLANYGSTRVAGTSMLGVPQTPGPGLYDIAPSTIRLTHGSWLLHGISKCVDYGITGASAAFARLVGADNFDDFGGDNAFDGDSTYNEAIGYGATPTEGIVPRSWVNGVPPGATPAWYTSATPNQWTAFADSVMPDGTITAFSGAFVNTTGVYIGATFTAGTWICVHGGGHGDSSNNGMYAFGPLEDAAPAWNLLSAVTRPDDVYWDDNDYPVSDHTYDNMVYIPSKNWMFKWGVGSKYHSSGGDGTPVIFDFGIASPTSNNPWRRGPVGLVGSTTETMALLDPNTGLLWCVTGGGSILDFEFGASYLDGTWTNHGRLFPDSFGQTGATLHPTKQLFFAPKNNSVELFNINNVAFGHWAVTPSGTGPGSPQCSAVWVPSEGKYAVYTNRLGSGENPRKVWWVNDPSDATSPGSTGWAWSSTTATGGEAPGDSGTNGQGIYNKFGVLPDHIRALYYIPFGGFPTAGASVYFWKLP